MSIDELNEIIADGTDSGWEVVDDVVIVTDCGDHVEWDCRTCPSCGSKNPLSTLGIV